MDIAEIEKNRDKADDIILYDRDKKILKSDKEVKQIFEDLNANSKKR